MSGGTTAVSIAVTAISTAMAMAAQEQQRRMQQNAMNAQAKSQAQALENEKAVKHEQAQNELAKGEVERTRQQREAMRRQGEAVAGMGASGLTLDSGSNLSMLGESMEEAQHDSNIITGNANQAAWRQQVDINGLGNQQAMLSSQTKNASTGPDWLGLGGTLLGGISGGMKQWNAYKKPTPDTVR